MRKDPSFDKEMYIHVHVPIKDIMFAGACKGLLQDLRN